MCKDRVRSVGWSNHRPSPHHTVLTTARVGPYGYIHTIYIRRYGHRPTTLILYTSHRATYLWDHIIYRPASSPIYGLTRCHIHMSHRPPKATDHQEPPNYWLTQSHHTRTCAGLISLFPATI
jgi:hypothetical protein